MTLFKLLGITLLLSSSSLFASTTVRGLPAGIKAPEISRKTIDKKLFSLKEARQRGPVVLVFYRGGWCPYCNLQLREMQQNLWPSLKKLGASLLAISVDQVSVIERTKNNESLDFSIMSDPSAKILKDYKVDYVMPKQLYKEYKEKYKIDLAKFSGKNHRTIAVPSVFVIDKEGFIRFSFADEDYKTRAKNADILNAVQALKK